MTSEDLARSDLAKARVRLKALALLRDEGGYSDVGREAAKFHDVGPLLVAHRARFSPDPRHGIEAFGASGKLPERP